MSKFNKSLCQNCRIDGVIVCTANKSSTTGCNKGVLTVDEAQERRKHVNEMWHNYIKTKHTAGK